MSGLLLVWLSLAPLTASAQWSGTNGQIFFQYTSATGDAQSIAAANPDMSESHIVIQGTAARRETAVAVSPDGTKIAYVEDDATDGTDQFFLKIANSNGSSPTTLYTAADSSGYESIASPTFSPDGATVFFTLGNVAINTHGIYSVPASGGSATLRVADTTGVQYENGGLVASAVSNKLFFLKQPSSGNTEINSSTLTGGSVTTVYTFGSSTDYPTLLDVSPDGSKLLFAKRYDQANGLQNLFTVDTATGTVVTAVTNLTTTTATGGSYSPDGAKLIYMEQSQSLSGTTLVGAKIVNADGSGTPTAFRQDAERPLWSTTSLATAGTYPTPLVLGKTGFQQGAGGSALPNTSIPLQRLPWALGLGAVITIGAIEFARRRRA